MHADGSLAVGFSFPLWLSGGQQVATPTIDVSAIFKDAQAKITGAINALNAQQKETQIVLGVLSQSDPHDRQMVAMILSNPDLKTKVEAVVSAWFRPANLPAATVTSTTPLPVKA